MSFTRCGEARVTSSKVARTSTQQKPGPQEPQRKRELDYMSVQHKKEKSGRNPEQGASQFKQPSNPRVLVQSGQIVAGRVIGFITNERNRSKREGVLIRLENGERALMRANQVGGAYPESRLERFRPNDRVRVEVTVTEEGQRRVKASERMLYFDEVAAQLADGLRNVSGVCVNKNRTGVLVKITTPGPAYNLIGLMHVSNMLESASMQRIQINQNLSVDIVSATVDRQNRLLRLSLASVNPRRQDIEDRFPVGVEVHARIVKVLDDAFELQLKGKELCLLPKTELDDLDPESLGLDVSLKLYVTGVDARGVILLSRTMPL